MTRNRKTVSTQEPILKNERNKKKQTPGGSVGISPSEPLESEPRDNLGNAAMSFSIVENRIDQIKLSRAWVKVAPGDKNL